MSDPVQYLHSSATKVLLENAASNPWHYEPLEPPAWTQRCKSAPVVWQIRSENNPLPDRGTLANALAHSDSDATSDAADALTVYSTLSMLTPQQAADNRLWVGLSHFELYRYVRKRWDSPRLANGADSAKKARYIRAHWFVSGPRGLIRDNAVSRLWWMGRILTLIGKRTNLPASVVGDTLFERADIRAQLFERPSTGSNIPLASEITLALREEAALKERDVFRSWMIRLNQLGGTILLDALRPDDLRRVVRREAKEAKADAALR